MNEKTAPNQSADPRNRVLLVDVLRETADEFRAVLAPGAELVPVTAAEVLEHTGGTPGERRPTVVVIGRRVPAPVGLIHSVHPHQSDLAVAVVSVANHDPRLATLPILFSADLVRQVPDTQADLLPDVARELLAGIARRRDRAAVRAAAQRQLASGTAADHRPGERLLGELLVQAPIGALMLDDDGALVAWNHRAADILELNGTESLRRPLAELFPPGDRAALRQHLAVSGEDYAAGPDVVFERTRSDGTGQALRVAPQRVTDAEGHRRLLVLAEDVTDRMHAQRKLAERTGHALLSAEVAAAMTAPGELAERLGRCVRAAADRLGAARVCIWTLRPSREPEHTVCAEADPDDGGTGGGDDVPLHPETERALVERIAAARRPLLDTVPEDIRPRGAFAGYPLVSGGELLGVLSLTTRLTLPGSTLSVLESIADQIAVGIQQDRLMHRLREATRALEEPLLPPRLPELPGFDLAARYHPFGSGLHIGGDFYDAFTVPDGRHVLVLGDVCGKGPGAAAITGLVRHTLWAAAQQDPEPAHVLGLVNRALRRQSTPFCTLTYAVLTPYPGPDGSARLRLVSAGHPAPLLRRADGTTVPLEIRGPLLGVLEELHHPVAEVALSPGETLVLYTDGFTEGAGREDRRESEDLAALVAAQPVPPPGDTGRPANDIAAALLRDAHDWWGERLRDDLAVLVLTALGRAPSR
ncbi:SpoIIE family protein phosphatase [Streptomyces sp. TRM 70361]|uniref:SpoIIE family protein phosphatase n=1 Tax=Streptomyces sp. TRM 70361 TaxID=3116553 RepID=UPI002E7BFCC6|nr:SpoIIE family protein phosphatase [Streptomyces sp. TRM 70361]MEE1942387.1 SpoIIE family protein phosphatase [Streptomyces sp. TRM 70361]